METTDNSFCDYVKFTNLSFAYTDSNIDNYTFILDASDDTLSIFFNDNTDSYFSVGDVIYIWSKQSNIYNGKFTLSWVPVSDKYISMPYTYTNYDLYKISTVYFNDGTNGQKYIFKKYYYKNEDLTDPECTLSYDDSTYILTIVFSNDIYLSPKNISDNIRKYGNILGYIFIYLRI